jgi:hypothetical protein
LRYDTLDILYISPFIYDENSKVFGGYKNSMEKRMGTLTARFESVVLEARTQNPSIKIVAMHMFEGGKSLDALPKPEDRTKFAVSVADFLRERQGKESLPDPNKAAAFGRDPNKKVSLQLDGYDIDYEGPNKQPWIADVVNKVRTEIQKVNSAFTVSLSADNVDHLAGKPTLGTDLDYINMQNYDGGRSTTFDKYLSAIPNFPSSKLLWGMTTELPWRNLEPVKSHPLDGIDQITKRVINGGHLGGVMLWRMNSDMWAFENMVQAAVYDVLHGTSHPELRKKVLEEWAKAVAGKDASKLVAINQNLEADYNAMNGYRVSH